MKTDKELTEDLDSCMEYRLQYGNRKSAIKIILGVLCILLITPVAFLVAYISNFIILTF
jgi:hypothetical protein